jgi:hypothetical protein
MATLRAVLRDVLKQQYELFLQLAARVAQADEAVNVRRDEYVRARRRAMPREAALRPDPFAGARPNAIDFFQVCVLYAVVCVIRLCMPRSRSRRATSGHSQASSRRASWRGRSAHWPVKRWHLPLCRVRE